MSKPQPPKSGAEAGPCRVAKAPMSLCPAWELPFVNVFQLCGLDSWKEAEKGGDVAILLDKDIGKKVNAPIARPPGKIHRESRPL